MRIGFLVVAFGMVISTAVAQEKPRNVVIIIADDLGRDLGCFGNKVIKTPNLDKLARRGVRFTNAYTSVASCSPSRASLLTGLYTHQTGQYGLQHSVHNQSARPKVVSIANMLAGAGFFTGLIGKFHVGPDSAYRFHVNTNKDTKGNRDVAVMAQHAAAFLKERGDKPFFLVHAFGDPHRGGKGFANEGFANDPAEIKYDPGSVVVPYFLPDTPEVRAELAEYYQSVSRMDRGVGLLLEVLAQAGVLDDTLIIFVSDNGIPFPGAKTTLYRSGTHLPLLMAGPGLPREHVNHTLVSYNDIVPTILNFTRIKGAPKNLPGKSLLPIAGEIDAKGWDGVFGSHQFHEITMYYPMRSLTTRKYKYIANLAHELQYPLASDLWGSASWQGMRKRGDKMMGSRSVASFLRRPKEELYDLAKDPNELTNLAGEPGMLKVLAVLRQQVRDWQVATQDPWLILNRDEDGKFNR